MGLTWIGLLGVAQAASASPPTTLPPNAHGHPYRHGVVPLRGHNRASSLAPPATSLTYGGGTGGVGVTTGAPKVYLVFWGSQWGTQGTDSNGYVTLSGDPDGAAPYLQAFLKGLGTGDETWSAVMTQYCQGIAAGSATCASSNSEHVGYPSGGALAGVWIDESSAAPAQATGQQIGAEAVRAATHFGNTTSAMNRNVQYVVVSPTGTNPDDYENPRTGFCAWHDYTGDTTLSGGSVPSADGQLAFTNLPYLTDAGQSCGQNFVNSGAAGTLDGFSIVEGHEFAETITDQFPAGGWTDSSGYENGDLCAWIGSGQGASQDITLTTGTFAVQSTWSNDSAQCEVSHSVVNNVTVSSPSNQTSTLGQPITPVQITASDSDSTQTLTYSATGLPTGLTINSTTGAISGTPTTVGGSSVAVTATDSTGASGGKTFTWTINKRSTSTSVSCSPTSITVGVQSACTATVTDTSSGITSTPGGTVSFSGSPTGSGAFSSASCTLAPTGTTGVASCQTNYTPSATGGESITGNYAGDTSHSTSISSGFGLTSTGRSSSTSVGCSPAPVNAGSSTSCTVTVTDTDSGTAATPTGTVTFGAAPTGQGSFTSSGCSLSSTGTTGRASCSVSYTPSSASPQTITASYAGDSAHSGSTSSGFALTVTGNTITVTDPGSKSTPVDGVADLPINASDSDSAQPLSYSASGLPSGLSINPTTGVISGSPTTLGSLSVSVTVGDATHASATATFSWTITKRSTSTAISCSPSSPYAGAPTTCSATVSDTDSGTPSTPTGTVGFGAAPANQGGFASSGCSLGPTGTPGTAGCNLTYTPSSAGSQTITGSYEGDGTHSTSGSSGSPLTVSAGPTPAAGGGNQTSGPGAATPNPAPGGVCASSLGQLKGATLGLVTLGMTRAQARGAYQREFFTSSGHQDLFCLTLRVGYPSPRLLKALTPRQRGKLSGRVIWMVTTSAGYSMRGVRAGESLPAAKRTLGTSTLVRVRGTAWYLFRGRSATLIVAVRGGVVREVGVANAQLTRTTKAASRLLQSLS